MGNVPDFDPIITADDVIRAGACPEGVGRVLHRLGRRVAAAMPLSALLKLLGEGEKEYATNAAKLDGSSYGSSSGYGYGSGYGSSYSTA